MAWVELLLLVAVGLVAGAINTIAGGGSLLTLPTLIFLGLPAGIANGTNRVGVVLQSAVATHQFHREGLLQTRLTRRLLLPTALGAGLGVWLSLDIDEEQFRAIIGVAMVVILPLVLLKPHKKREVSDDLAQSDHTTNLDPQKNTAHADAAHGNPPPPYDAEGQNAIDAARVAHKGNNAAYADDAEVDEPAPAWLQIVIFFAIGVYGGFLQAGVGVFILTALVHGAGQDLVRSNAVKVTLVVVFATLSMGIFAWQDMIAWEPALALAAGSMGGGWVGTKMTVSWGPSFVRWVLVVTVLASASKLLGLW